MVVVPYEKVSFVQILTSNIMLTCHIEIVKKDASLNTRLFKISVDAHSFIYSTLMKKGVFAYLHDSAVYFLHREFINVYSFL